jgi:hypothetical protein
MAVQGLFGAPRQVPRITPELGAMMRRERGVMPGDQPGIPDMPPGQAPQKRDTLRRIAGYFADFTAGLAGQQGPYASMLAQQQDQAEKQRQASLERSTEWEDWVRREQWKRDNPSAQPYRWESNDGDVYELGPGGQPTRVFDDPAPRMQMIMGPDGRPYFMNPQGGSPPTSPVGRLTPIEGGPASQAPGGFPR